MKRFFSLGEKGPLKSEATGYGEKDEEEREVEQSAWSEEAEMVYFSKCHSLSRGFDYNSYSL